MNFQEEGGYTVHLLNNKDGPKVFYVICICCFLVCVAYFMKQGWISPIFFPTYIRRKFTWCMSESVLKDDDRFISIHNTTTTSHGNSNSNGSNSKSGSSGEHGSGRVRGRGSYMSSGSKRGPAFADKVAARRYDIVRTKRSLMTLGKQVSVLVWCWVC